MPRQPTVRKMHTVCLARAAVTKPVPEKLKPSLGPYVTACTTRLLAAGRQTKTGGPEARHPAPEVEPGGSNNL